MHAYLFVGNDLEAHIASFVSERRARRVNFELKTVKDAREITSFVSTSFTEPTVLVITGIDEASDVAQNAFLKTLEESAGTCTFLLTAKRDEGIIPTIQSRCQIMRFSASHTDMDPLVLEFVNATPGEKLKTLAKYGTRPEAIEFMTAVSRALKDQMLEDYTKAPLLQAAQECIAALEANANVTGATTLFVMKCALTTE